MLTMATTFRAEPTTPVLDGDEAWRAVERRDARFDGRFVYAVRSTRIYCRPSCPSRRPARERVYILRRARRGRSRRAIARAAAVSRVRQSSRRRPVAVERARRLHRDSIPIRSSRSPSAGSRTSGLSPFHLQRTFKRLLGVSPREYQDALRVTRFKSRLRAGDTVSRATYEAGFGSSSRVYERSDDTLGMTPAAYRRGGAGMHITYTIVDSPFGKLLVGATERGVCAVALGDSDEALVRALCARFSACRDRARRRCSSRLGRGDRWQHRRRESGTERAARRAGNRVSAAGVGTPAEDSARSNAVVRRGRCRARESASDARRRAGLREQSNRGRDSMSSRRSQRRRARRLQVGRRTQKDDARARARSVALTHPHWRATAIQTIDMHRAV